MPSLELILYQHLCRQQKLSHSDPPCPVSVSRHFADAKKSQEGIEKGKTSSQEQRVNARYGVLWFRNLQPNWFFSFCLNPLR